MTQAVNNTRVLGEITFNERRYVAILHYYGEDGTPREITPQMQNVNEIYRRALQNVVDRYNSSLPDSLMKLSEGGFTFQEETLPHTDTTKQAWENFHYLLANPEIANESRFALHPHNSVELVDITDLTTERRLELRQGIINKFLSETYDPSTKVGLTPEEMAILGTDYPHLSQGIRSADEILALSIDHWSEKVADLSEKEKLKLKMSVWTKYHDKTGLYSDGPTRFRLTPEEQGVLGRDYPSLSRGIRNAQEIYNLAISVAAERNTD